MGRPSKYNEEIANKICDIIATSSKGLRAISKEVDLNVTTIMDWVKNNESFSKQYARAKMLQADLLVEEILEIADNDSKDTLMGEFGEMGNPTAVNRAKLRADTRKWLASKLAPKVYGDKLELSGDAENPLQIITGMRIE